MTTVANLSGNLTLQSSEFDTRLTRARGNLRRTANSMSSSLRGFEVRTQESFRRASQSVAAFQGPLGPVAGRLTTLGTIIGTTGLALGGFALATTGVAIALQRTVQTASRFEQSSLRIQGLLRATGSASGQTADGIRQFSRELALSTLASTEGVEQAAAALLTFRSIAGNTFQRTLTLAQDLAASGFGSLQTNVVQLGKALEDPIMGLTSLRRVGVSFSQSQRDLIKSLVEAGDAAAAQTVILDTLQSQVGGAGSAEAGGLAGAFDTLGQRVEEFFLILDRESGLTDKFTRSINALASGIGRLNDSVTPADNQTRLSQINEEIANEQAELEAILSRGPVAPDQFRRESQVRIDALNAERQAVSLLIQQEAIRNEQARAGQERARLEAQADLEVQKAREAREKAEKQAVRAAERRQETITKTVERLRQEFDVLALTEQALRDESNSMADVATQAEIYATQKRLGIEAGSKEAEQVRLLIDLRNRLREAVNAETESRENRLRIGRAIDDLGRAADEAQELREATQAGKERVAVLRDELEVRRRIKELRDSGATDEEVAEATDAIRARQAADRETDEANRKLEEMERRLERIGDRAVDAFVDFASGAKSASDAVKQLGLDIVSSLGREIGSSLISDAFKSGIGTLFGGFFADGGRPPMGKVSVVGERGPELFVPDTAGTIISNDNMQKINSGPSIFIDARGADREGFRELSARVEALNGSVEERAINAVEDQFARNPSFGRR